MSGFHYQSNRLFSEEVSIDRLAQTLGTPLYVYSKLELVEKASRYRIAIGPKNRVCYAVKANSNHTILAILKDLGLGFDVVSLGEIERALRAGATPGSLVFSGVGKTENELLRAVSLGVFAIVIESRFELENLIRISNQLKKRIQISIRINPNVDVKTMPYIATGLYENKFGIPETELNDLVSRAQKSEFLELGGIGIHLGSQIKELAPFKEVAKHLCALAKKLITEGAPLKFIDMGGGLGVSYLGETVPTIEEYAESIAAQIKVSGLTLVVEPGRSIVAESGMLVTKVLGIKETPKKKFCIVDAAMSDLLRPSLYGAEHRITQVYQSESTVKFDVVGPVCESGDFLGKDVLLGKGLKQGEFLSVWTAGAYGMSMSSNYNSRPRALEVMVDGDSYQVIRNRESIESLWAFEENLLLDKKFV